MNLVNVTWARSHFHTAYWNKQ